MSAVEAILAARAAGVDLGIDGDDLVLEASAAPPPVVLDLLSRHKVAIVTMLRPGADGWSAEDWQAFFDERAGIAEFEGGLPREQAEARAFHSCAAEWLSRNPDRLLADRCLGCGEAEHTSDALLLFGSDASARAWLHARCWTRWNATRWSAVD